MHHQFNLNCLKALKIHQSLKLLKQGRRRVGFRNQQLKNLINEMCFRITDVLVLLRIAQGKMSKF